MTPCTSTRYVPPPLPEVNQKKTFSYVSLFLAMIFPLDVPCSYLQIGFLTLVLRLCPTNPNFRIMAWGVDLHTETEESSI